MMLGAASGDTIEITVTGKHAEANLERLAGLVIDGFGEDWGKAGRDIRTADLPERRQITGFSNPTVKFCAAARQEAPQAREAFPRRRAAPADRRARERAAA